MKYALGSDQRPLKVAIIGSGPAGFYAAERLLKQEDISVEVDMFEMLPTPFGLVRAGVAPDHQKIKSVTKLYDTIAQLPQFRFWGNVEFGKALEKSDLLDLFDAIIYAIGLQSDRGMGIPGENLDGSCSATDFVGWYNGHPDFQHLNFDFTTENVAIIGMGNVAMDVSRILAMTIEELSTTDIAHHALEQLKENKIKNIYLIARRGPMQAAFDNTSTKVIPNLSRANALVNPDELKLEQETKKILEQTKDRKIINNLKFLDAIAKNSSSSKHRNIHFLFRRSPLEIYTSKNNTVGGLRIVKNELFHDELGSLKSRATDICEDIEAGLIIRSIGYKLKPLQGVPYDANRGVIANDNGRVVNLETQTICSREYVTGWAKRGPTGVIGSNKPDAYETVELLLEDFENKSAEAINEPHLQQVTKLLDSKKLIYVPFEDWKILDQAELENGMKKDKPSEKVTTVKEMLKLIKEG
jgi:ferredoxin--NADP+ reductase